MKKFVPTFEITLQSSKFLGWLVRCSFLLAIASCWLNSFSFISQIALTAVVLFIYVYVIYSGNLNYSKVTKIHCKADGSWLVFKNNLEPETYQLKNSSTILGPLFFLHLQSKKESLYLVLANSSMLAEESRKLRVALRVYKNQILQVKA